MSSQVSLRNCPSPMALDRLLFAFGSPSDSAPIIRFTTASIGVPIGSSTNRESGAQYDAKVLCQSMHNALSDMATIISGHNLRPLRGTLAAQDVERSC